MSNEYNDGNRSIDSRERKRLPRWMQLPTTYRQREASQIATWIESGASGCVVGLAESGRSNLLTFLCHRRDVLEEYLSRGRQVTLIPIDLFNLPANDLSNLYRTILHAFYWERDCVPPDLHAYATELYMANRASVDPFLPQMATYDLLRAFEDADQQVVLVLNRFDRFCATATPQMLNTLRGLRDSFKSTLTYIVGMLQEVIYLANEAEVGDMYDILDRRVCWVGTMTDKDAGEMLLRDVLPKEIAPTSAEMNAILQLSGCFPGLIRTVGFWWLNNARANASNEKIPIEGWQDALLQEPSIQFRLERIWNSLTQEEQLALSETQKLEQQLIQAGCLPSRFASPTLTSSTDAIHLPSSSTASPKLPAALKKALEGLVNHYGYALSRLATKGLCKQVDSIWTIQSRLVAAFVEIHKGRAKGRIWVDEQTKQLHQGQETLQDVTGLQHAILAFMVQNARARLTYDDIISNAWPEEEQRDGISDNALQVHIRSIRKRIEPNPAKPNYLVTWRGTPGGYIFYPEGRPE
ncbi:MAG: helix-turn-helix domain-containing protein [Chloroflexota bacterium]